MKQILASTALWFLFLLQGYCMDALDGEFEIQSNSVSNGTSAAWNSSTGIRCSKVHEMIISYSDHTEATEYVCELHPSHANGVIGTEYSLRNLTDDFPDTRARAMQDGLESLYIPGGAVINDKVTLLDTNDENMSLTWFHDPSLDNDGDNKRRSLAVNQSGTRTTLIVRITANSISPGPTANELTDTVFGTHGNTVSVETQYNACSDNQFRIVKATGTTSKGIQIKNGLVEVNVGWTSDLSVYTISNLAKSLMGDITMYDHVMFDLPMGTTYGDAGTDWFAFGYRPGTETFFGHTGSNIYEGGRVMLSTSAIVHEVGHNLGLRHSGEADDEYADYTCQMGISSEWYASRCFNGAKFVELGWYDDRVVALNPATTTFNGKVVGVHDLNSRTLSQEYTLVVAIDNALNFAGPKLYLTFNVKEGITNQTGDYPGEVVIVEATPGDNWSQSLLVSHLRAGQDYVISNYKGDRDLVIQVTAIGTDNGIIDYASVIVKLDNSNCSKSSHCNDSDQCTTDSCVFGKCVYTISPGCCGNGVCELSAGETCSTCPSDCTAPTNCNELVGPGSWIAVPGYQGFMMDIKAINDIHLQSISFYSYNSVSDTGVITASIYTKSETWVGSEKKSFRWQLISDSLQINGERTSVYFDSPNSVVFHYEVPLSSPANIDSSKTQAFYISAHNRNDVIVYGDTGQSHSNVDLKNYDLETYEIALSELEFFSYTSYHANKFKGSILYGYGEYGFESPTASPVESHIIPTIAPTASPVKSPPTNIPHDSSFMIMSDLSTSNKKWCLFPKSNYLVAGTIIALGTCQDWDSYQWIIDDEGKIRNKKAQQLCIQLGGKKLTVQNCKSNFFKQRFIYNDNGRIIAVQNGFKGMSVNNGVAKNSQPIRIIPYKSDGTTDADTWTLMTSSGMTVPLPNLSNIENFRIKSDLSIKRKEWCISSNGSGMILGICNTWNTFKWKMDSEGKVENVRYEQCIESKGKRMFLAKCVTNKLSQRWTYSVLDERLVLLKKGNKHATVEGGIAVNKAKLKVILGKYPAPPHQKWIMEKV